MNKLQLWGIVYVISLVFSMMFIDRLVILDLPFSLNVKEWPCLVYAMIFAVATCVTSWFILRNEEKREKVTRHRWNEKIMLMFTNTAKGNYLDIIVLFVFLAYAAWIPDTCFDWIKEGRYGIRPIIYLIGLGLFVWGKPQIVSVEKTIEPEERKILLTGMSNVSYISYIKQMNIYPLIEPLKKYTNIETFIVLLSDLVWDRFNNIDPLKETDELLKSALENYKKEIEKLNFKVEKTEEGDEKKEKLEENTDKTQSVKQALKELLLAYIKTIPAYKNREINIVFSEPVDYNDFDACNNKCYQALKYIMGEGVFAKYKDFQVVVNTTPGTAIVTSAMTINAIKGNRAMIYTTQGNKPEVRAANPNATLIQFDSLIEERELN